MPEKDDAEIERNAHGMGDQATQQKKDKTSYQKQQDLHKTAIPVDKETYGGGDDDDDDCCYCALNIEEYTMHINITYFQV